MNIYINWRKCKNCLTAGPRLIITGKRIGKLHCFSRCFGSNGTVYNRWVIVARFWPGKVWWAWSIEWEPRLNRTLGFSYNEVPGLRHLRRGRKLEAA